MPRRVGVFEHAGAAVKNTAQHGSSGDKEVCLLSGERIHDKLFPDIQRIRVEWDAEIGADDTDGFDHGVGHSLLLLYDARVSNGQKSKEFKGLGHYLSNTSISSF